MDFIKNFKNNLDEDEKLYHNFIKGKRVVIVGPSPYLLDKNMGSFFDTFDIIVHINQGIYLPITNSKDYGSRTDIIYTSQRARDTFIGELPEEYHKTKYIVMLTQKKLPHFPENVICSICLNNVLDGEEYCLNKGWLDGDPPNLNHPRCVYPPNGIQYNTTVPVIKRDISIYQKTFNISLLSGLLAIIDMIQFEAKEIHVYGFDFYNCIKESIISKTGLVEKKQVYCESYKVLPGTMSLSHKDSSGQQLFFLKKLMRIFPNIYIDENLTKILSQYNHQSNLEYCKKFVNNYSSLIRNKRVVVVGPGPCLEGKSLGDKIDSYDFVVRLNMGQTLCLSNEKDFGKKTNALYINHKVRDILPIDESNIRESEYILFPRLNNTGLRRSTESKCYNCQKNIEEMEEIIIKDEKLLHCSCDNEIIYQLYNNKIITLDVDHLYKELQEEPLIGLVAVDHILKFKPKELLVLGFDFYNELKNSVKLGKQIMNLNELYSKGYEFLEKIDHRNKDNNGRQLKYFKKLKKNNKNLFIEKNLKLILNQN